MKGKKSLFLLQTLKSFVVPKWMPVQQAVSKQSLSKHPASPPTVQWKVAKKPSTIASHGHGGGNIATRSRQAP
jgi:hypothetical protein